jgi:hypothetical protein
MFKFRWLALIALVAVTTIAVGSNTSQASVVDLGSLSPTDPAAQALYCDNADINYWYQVQHRDSITEQVDFVGSTVACSGWEAIRQFAAMHNYASTNAASNDGVIAGNRGRAWVAGLDPISDYTP